MPGTKRKRGGKSSRKVTRKVTRKASVPARKSPARKSPVSASARVMTRAQIVQQFAKQKVERALKRQHTRAKAARNAFRVKAKDKGKLIFVNASGQRGAEMKGRKGYLIYVTKTGKKRLVTERGATAPHKPRNLGEVNVPAIKIFRKRAKEFVRERLETTATGESRTKGNGNVNTGGAYEFGDKVVRKIARSLQKTIEGQRSQRVFVINTMVRVTLPDGTERVYDIAVPIERADHVAVRLGGLENFVRRKFYAAMAHELAFDGYVSNGSANHIRRLPENAGVPREEWTQSNGSRWEANESQQVTIKQIQWRILQAK